jgi:hypothetical protein
MEENTKAEESTPKVKAISVDIAKILEQSPNAISVNIYYTIENDDLNVKAMEIVSPNDEAKPEESVN